MTLFDTRDREVAGHPQILIRRADLGRPADADALLLVIDAYARDPMGDGRPLTAETRACLIPALRQVPNAIIFLAVEPTVSARSGSSMSGPCGDPDTSVRAVGAAVCFVGFSTFRARGLINVHDLAVVPSWRGRGVGTLLLAAVEALARKRGYCKVNLEVRRDNPARQLYRRLGFGAAVSGAQAGSEPVQYLFLEKRLD